MASSLIIFILIVISYFYTSSHPIERIKLKQSVGWVTFVLLGKNSIILIFDSTIYLIILWLLLYFFALIFSIPYYLGFDTTNFTTFLYLDTIRETITYSLEREFLFWIFIFFCSISRIKSLTDDFKKQPIDKKLTTLRSAIDDGKIRIIIDALATQTPVKISLKSRKIYVGIVVHEHFEPSDLDNIIIIPYFSGYRNKDTLKLYLDTNYAEIYIKNDLINLKKENDNKGIDIDHFRCVISADEIESISLFNIKYFNQFSAENIIPSSKENTPLSDD